MPRWSLFVIRLIEPERAELEAHCKEHRSPHRETVRANIVRSPWFSFQSLVIGYHKANASPILKLFLSRSDHLISHAANKVRSAANASG